MGGRDRPPGPTIGARTPVSTAIGTRTTADSVGDIPPTSWRKNVKGIIIADTAKPIDAMPMVDSEKLRSRNSDNGTRGSVRMRDCQ